MRRTSPATSTTVSPRVVGVTGSSCSILAATSSAVLRGVGTGGGSGTP